MLPGMIMAASLGIEVGGWGATQVRTQRIADAAASAGVTYLNQSFTNPTAAQYQATALYAISVAQMNGVAAGTNVSTPLACSGCVYTALNGNVAVAIDSRTRPVALSVTVATQVPAPLSAMFTSGQSTYTITAKSGSAWIAAATTFGSSTGSSMGGQPCVVALAGARPGAPANTSVSAISMNGTSTLTASHCTVTSNAGISFSGGPTMQASEVYASGTINSTSNITGTAHQNQPQITDPYLNVSSLQTALTNANRATGTGSIACKGVGQGTNCSSSSAGSSAYSCNGGGSCTLYPGTYTSLDLNSSASVMLSEGLYVFTDTINLGGQSSVTGTNVTIVQSATTPGGSANSLTIAGGAGFALTPATPAEVAGYRERTNNTLPAPVSGVAYASQSSATSAIFKGNSTSPLEGTIYYPNGTMKDLGTASAGTPTCSILIAKAIIISGTSTYQAGGCSSYNLPDFGSLPAVSVARLIN